MNWTLIVITLIVAFSVIVAVGMVTSAVERVQRHQHDTYATIEREKMSAGRNQLREMQRLAEIQHNQDDE